MTQQQAVDPSTLSFEELQKLANAELVGDKPVVQDPPPAADPDPDPDALDEVVYRRVIDLGDGSGTQVFEAPTVEELVDKLADAQTHATRKIRELSAAQKPKEVVPALDENEEFVLSQQFLQSPTKAFADLFKRTTGKDIEGFKTTLGRMEAFERGQSEFGVGQEFQRLTPEYHPSEKNGKKIEKWLKTEGLEVTIENVQKAFADLTESGLLESAPQNQDAEPQKRAEETTRIAETTTRIVGQRRAASGLSSQGSKTVTRAPEPTPEELYSMPMDKLAALAFAEANKV